MPSLTLPLKTFLNDWRGRIAVCVLIGCLLAWGMSEITFLILKDTSDHAPQQVELVIPNGTAARIAAGEAPLSTPKEMVFVVGDTLVVRNEDVVSHQLGPVWAPPGATASLLLDEANQFSYACTFQTSRAFGLDVRPRVNWQTRFQAVFLAGPPMGALIAIYSFVLFPLNKVLPPKRLEEAAEPV